MNNKTGVKKMKKLLVIMLPLVFMLALSACDLIEEEIERAQSLELEDYEVDIPEQSILLKITSDADEQVVESVVVNDTEYELVSRGDDWYLLEDVPIETAYEITDVYYRTGIGAGLTYNVDYDITLGEAIEKLPQEKLEEVDEELIVGDYHFRADEDELVVIESDRDFVIEELEEWAWLVFEDEIPLFAVFEYEDTLYVVIAPEEIEDHVE